jgi:hypothetical protein
MPLKKKFHKILESKKSNHQFLLGELAIKYKEIIACENKHFYSVCNFTFSSCFGAKVKSKNSWKKKFDSVLLRV